MVLTVVEGDGGTFFLGGCFHADTFEYAIVVYDKFVVGSEPDIELGAVAVDGVSFHQGGNTILGRAVGLPETKRCANDLGVLGPVGCRMRQNDIAEANKSFFSFIVPYL